MNHTQRYRELLRACHREVIIRDPEPADWSRWGTCPICLAETGSPCTRFAGRSTNLVEVPALRPHGGRRVLSEVPA